MFPIAISAMSPNELEQMIRFRWMVAGGKEAAVRRCRRGRLQDPLRLYGLVTAKLCDLAIYDQCQRPSDLRACTG